MAGPSVSTSGTLPPIHACIVTMCEILSFSAPRRVPFTSTRYDLLLAPRRVSLFGWVSM